MSNDDSQFTPTLLVKKNDVRRFPVAYQLIFLGVFLLVLFVLASGSPGALYTRLLQLKNTPSDTAQLPAVEALETSPSVPQVVNEAAVPVTAKAAFVWDVVGQRVLYSKSPDEVLPLASVTKLMTALVAYELVSGDMGAMVPSGATTVQSASGLRAGEVFTVRKLTDLALLSSSNDAAYSLANAVGALLGPGDETAQFVEAMNIRAAELGFTTLDFDNMTGLDISTTKAGAYGSAREVAGLMSYILEHHPELLAVTRRNAIRVVTDNGDYHDAENTNPLVDTIPNLLGSKTGYTDLAGGNLVVAFDAAFNRPVVMVVLGSSHQGRFDDVERLVQAVLKTAAE